MKKLLITLFTILYCFNPVLAEVIIEHKNKDTFTPKEYILNKEELEEIEEINIDWNKWHADVRNAISPKLQKLRTRYNNNYLIEYLMYVDANKNIFDIAIVFVPESSMNLPAGAIMVNKPAYAYYYSKNKFYELTALSNNISISKKNDRILNQLNKFKVSAIDKQYVPKSDLIIQYAQTIKNMNGASVLTYPHGTKRTKVKVQMDTFPTRWVNQYNWYCVDTFKPTHFNDSEKQKNKKE